MKYSNMFIGKFRFKNLMKKHINLIVKGKVQGVWFRASTLEKANNLGLSGFVKNMTNGDVYIEAEGSLDKLEKFKMWCRKGPTLARVDSLNEEYGPLQDYENFKII